MGQETQTIIDWKGIKRICKRCSRGFKRRLNRVKEALLNALGMTHTQCVEELFRCEKKQNLTMPEEIHQVEFILARLLQECTTKDEVIQTLLIARVYSWSSPKCAAFIRLQKPITDPVNYQILYLHSYRYACHIHSWCRILTCHRPVSSRLLFASASADFHDVLRKQHSRLTREEKISKIKSGYPHVSHVWRKDISQMNDQKQTITAQVRVVVTPTPKQPKLVKGKYVQYAP